jgi:ubiquinone/menaquinone biosynthesis C-methylase UbiE
MRDLSVFPDASFDVVFNPVSNVFCPELARVWRESFRVLRLGGILEFGHQAVNHVTAGQPSLPASGARSDTCHQVIEQARVPVMVYRGSIG